MFILTCFNKAFLINETIAVVFYSKRQRHKEPIKSFSLKEFFCTTDIYYNKNVLGVNISVIRHF